MSETSSKIHCSDTMSRRYASTDSAISGYISDMIAQGIYSPKTIAHMNEHLRLVKRYLEGISIYEITADDVRDISVTMANEGLAVSTQKSYMHALKSLLKFVKNPAYDTTIVFQADTRPKVDWLTVDDARRVLDYPLSPKSHLIVVLALCMGLRRVEIVRLKVSDIDLKNQYITVTGKGMRGGKLRLVPFHPRFLPALESYLKDRARMLASSKERPEELIIWKSNSDGNCYEYNAVKGSGMDKLVRLCSTTIGVHFSAHTLRRTFGRMMWLSGVPVVTIAKMLGHSSTEQTLQYIGANLDDMTRAMHNFNLQ